MTLNSFAESLALVLSVAAAVPVASSHPDQEGGLLRAEQLYNGVSRPVIVEISPERGDENLAIVLMDADGQLLVEPRSVRPGRIDLAELLPPLWQLREACYLQLTVADDPVGSALVVQPMINRPAMWTEQALRPDGTTKYTRIVGWGNEPPDEWKERQPGSTTGLGGDPAPEEEDAALCGLRIYPEVDVVLETTAGDITVALRPDAAPNTAWNFRELAGGGFYSEVIFHRIVPLDRNGQPFVIQGGDPTGTGNGGPGYWLPLEPSDLSHDFGVISMARANDPDSAGSQFFFCLSRDGTARLDGQYCAFGYAVKGADVIKAIAETKLADVATGRPQDPPLIYRARLVPAPPRMPGDGRPDEKVTPADGQPPKPPRVPR